ncbi:MAG: cobalamin biosynthesis protein [Desulfovibrio sp.]|nr:cobalamin biosynthesis protein [Desulfovibrio sp.]
MILPYTVFDCPWIAPLALLLDFALGDPKLPWPHPVVVLGRILHALEQRIRPHLQKHPQTEWFVGRLLGALSLLGVSALVALTLAFLCSLPFVGGLFACYFAYAGLAMGCLIQTGHTVLIAIENDPLPQARTSLSMLVSRDTSQMDKNVLQKTLADTLSENFTDALVAPFFWLLLTGPVGLWIYKTISTMDSMWGYTTTQWRYLGWAGARMDDVAAFIPARIAILVVGLYDWCVRTFAPQARTWEGSYPGFFALHKQALGMPSPNSGCSMNVFAWLINSPMAGPSIYFGKMVEKPWLGPPSHAKAWDAKRLRLLLTLLHHTGLFGMLVVWALCVALCLC